MIGIQYIINGLTTMINVMRMRLNGFTVGQHPRLCGYLHLNIHNNVNFSVGKYCVIVSGGGRNEIGRNVGTYITLYDNASLKIGDYTGISDVAISCRKSIVIGNHVTIGGDVIIIDSNAHCIDWKLRRRESKERKQLDAAGHIKHANIKIEDDVFIGARSIITKGVTIGARSVVAAGSVVICDIPSDEIWGGNPAKFIKRLS